MNILHLEFLAKNNHLEHLKDNMLYPDFNTWGSLNYDEFSQSFQNLASLLSAESEIRGLLELRMISEYLLFREKSPNWFGPWLRDTIDISKYLPGVDWEQITKGHWHAAPVILFLDRAYLRYFVVGLVSDGAGFPIMPGWTDEIMDGSTKEAIREASLASYKISPLPPKQTLYCYPLTVVNRSIQFKGSSLGLPIALGFLKLLTMQKTAENLVATGAVSEQGIISKVGNVEEKAQFAWENFEAFLYPSDNFPLSGIGEMTMLQVSDLEQAWMFFVYYSPENSHNLSLFSSMLKDPKLFVDNCNNVPPQWLVWAKEHDYTRGVMDDILHSPGMLLSLCDGLDGCLEKGDLEQSKSICDLIPPEIAQETGKISPLSMFRWCTLNLALSNHRGKISVAKRWINLAASLEGLALCADVESVVTYYNHFFIYRHNLYHFEPKLPEQLSKILGFLEGQYSLRCDFGSSTYMILGRLYGSIAQNYAFCGPDYFQDTESYTLKARKALGEGTAPEFKNEWMRQLNYLTYAALDAGMFDKAEETLITYMDSEEWHGLWPLLPELSSWQHAILARFHADAGKPEIGDKYLNWAQSEMKWLTRPEHPWQLWLFNLGRIAQQLGERQVAIELYRESLELCLADKNGPTVHVMALLPLSGIWRLNALGELDVKKQEKEVRKAAGMLNRDHFRTLFDKNDFEKVLEAVWDKPGTLFPFSYR